MPFVSHRLIGSPSVRLIRSPTGSAACLIPFASLIGSSSRLPASYRSAPRPIDKRSGAKPQSTAGGGGEWLTAAAWLLAYPGWRRGGYRLRMAAGGGSDGVAVGEESSCLLALGAIDGAARSSLFPISSAHPIDGEGPSFPLSPDPLPPALLCLLAVACSPVLGRGCAGYGMVCGGGRACCLLAFSSPVPLSRSRSFARCYMPRVACAVVPIRGVVGRFTGYSNRLPVGVGVFQYMPLNGILWLLMGIFGDVVRCPFSALPVASFSPLCPAARPFSAAGSWPLVRVFSCGELVKTARVRSFVPGAVFPLLVSCG